MTDLSRFYYKDTTVFLISIFDVESNKIILFQVSKILYNFIETSNCQLSMGKSEYSYSHWFNYKRKDQKWFLTIFKFN